MAKITDENLQELIISIIEAEDEGESGVDLLKEFLNLNYSEKTSDQKKKAAEEKKKAAEEKKKAQATGGNGQMQGMF